MAIDVELEQGAGQITGIEEKAKPIQPEKRLDKNLANCKPSEFLAQTIKIRRHAAEWLDATKIFEIRKTVPKISENASPEKRRKAIEAQAKKNLGRMFDAVFEENAEKTLELLALMCFVEPEKVDDYPVREYLRNFYELLNCPEVLSFFTSLVQLVNKSSFGIAKQ